MAAFSATGRGRRVDPVTISLFHEKELARQMLIDETEGRVPAGILEVRNVSEAMTMLCEDLRRRHDLGQDQALKGLDSLVQGLETIASELLRPFLPGDLKIREVEVHV